ncbi:three-Cys-motif partner protein TcmP [Eggerthellaceae bacterium zg-893]|nr:three-Cys-motif partner protein TcmP [Eggerthellaceae bacterium zg-893]
MAKDQSDYFRTKQVWSKTKDGILGCYFAPYFSKVIPFSKDGIVYVDAFAGTDVFEDGEPGSPLIALSELRGAMSKQRQRSPIKIILAEKDDSIRAKLESVVRKSAGGTGYLQGDRICFADSFENAMTLSSQAELRTGRQPSTFFYYIDPYGIKDFRLSLVAGSPVPGHTEMLLNFSSSGFIRDARAALKVALTEQDENVMWSVAFAEDVPTTTRVERLNEAIGSDGWIELVIAYGRNEMTHRQLEIEVSALLCRNAQSYYRYVTNMPIRDVSVRREDNGAIKYRLVHMTNNHDGCVLVNDNMIKRNRDTQVIQQQLFLVDIDGNDIDSDTISSAMRKSVMTLPLNKPVSMWAILADVIAEVGVFDKSTAVLKTYLGPLIEEGLVERVEKFTPKTGKPKNTYSGPKTMVYRAK